MTGQADVWRTAPSPNPTTRHGPRWPRRSRKLATWNSCRSGTPSVARPAGSSTRPRLWSSTFRPRRSPTGDGASLRNRRSRTEEPPATETRARPRDTSLGRQSSPSSLPGQGRRGGPTSRARPGRSIASAIAHVLYHLHDLDRRDTERHRGQGVGLAARRHARPIHEDMPVDLRCRSRTDGAPHVRHVSGPLWELRLSGRGGSQGRFTSRPAVGALSWFAHSSRGPGGRRAGRLNWRFGAQGRHCNDESR